MHELGFDAGLHAAARWRSARRWLLLLVAVGAFVTWHGVPHLRVSYAIDGRSITSGSYWSVTGSRHVVAGEFARQCPPIVLVPLDRPLWDYAADALDELVAGI